MLQPERSSVSYEEGRRVRGCNVHRSKLGVLVLFALATIVLSIPVLGQETWQVDAQNSVARLSLGSGSDALEIGLARINGDVVFESSVGADPRVHLRISTDGSGPEQAKITFMSKRSAIADGKLALVGDLTVTRAERSVIIEPNEAYHGAEYGEPVVSSATREITLVVSAPEPAEAESSRLEFSGSTTITQEAFPQLVSLVEQADWPTVLVNDRTCEAPSTIGEDYHGATCTGTLIASVHNRTVASGSASGEDYHGFAPLASPDRNLATIALDVKLRRVRPVSSFIQPVTTAPGR